MDLEEGEGVDTREVVSDFDSVLFLPPFLFLRFAILRLEMSKWDGGRTERETHWTELTLSHKERERGRKEIWSVVAMTSSESASLALLDLCVLSRKFVHWDEILLTLYQKCKSNPIITYFLCGARHVKITYPFFLSGNEDYASLNVRISLVAVGPPMSFSK